MMLVLFSWEFCFCMVRLLVLNMVRCCGVCRLLLYWVRV